MYKFFFPCNNPLQIGNSAYFNMYLLEVFLVTTAEDGFTVVAP